MASFGIVVFPGTWSDRDCYHAVHDRLGQEARYIWDKGGGPSCLDCVILAGGFSYGDYLRSGAIARMSPVMEEVGEFAERGGYVIGICNGFQVLCESHLLPGALMRNSSLEFRCQQQWLRVETSDTAFTSESAKGRLLRLPVSHGEGNYYADPDTLGALESGDRVVFRYATADGDISDEANPTGTPHNIAGVFN